MSASQVNTDHSYHFVQTPHWAEVRRGQGHHPYWIEERLMLVKKAPKPFLSVGVMSQLKMQGLDLSKIYAVGRQLNLSHIQLDPNDESTQFSLSEDTKKRYLFVATESLIPRHTVLLDLTLPEDELLTNMKKNWRYNCTLARKKGVVSELRDDAEAVDIFNKLYFRTVAAKGFLGRNPAYFKHVWETLRTRGVAKILVASVQGVPLVARMIFLHEGTIFTAYTGTSREQSDTKAAYGAMWDLIAWGKQNSFHTINLWGVNPDAQEGDPDYGYTQFKTGFGGRVVEYAPAYDLVISRFAYYAFRIANKSRLMLAKLRSKLRT